MFKATETRLPGVVLLEPSAFRDARGFFLESHNQRAFAALGIDCRFVQDNHSKSVKGTIRGLHYQLPNPQAKLCRVVQGTVWDVAVDIRVGSPNFGKWTGVTLSDKNQLEVFIPAGFAHGFAVISETADFLYKCSEYYAREDDRGIAWDDPSLAIDWQVGAPVLSEKDLRYPTLSRVSKDLLPGFQAGCGGSL